MSRIIKITFSPCFFIISLMCFYLSIYWIGTFFIALSFLWLLNLMVLYKIKKEREPFNAFSSTRNVDYLIIGDIYDISNIILQDKKYVQILIPDCNEKTAYELLRHTYSILKDKNGTAIIATKRNNLRNVKEYSIFAIPFFNQITINRLNLHHVKKKSFFPIIFSPVGTLKFMMRKTNKKIYNTNCKNELMKAFCEERKILLIWKETF